MEYEERRWWWWRRAGLLLLLSRLRVTFVGAVVIVSAVGLVLSLFGVESLAARVLYSLFAVVYFLYVLYEVYNDARALFNRSTKDDLSVTFYTLLDATVGYVLAGSLLLMLFWVWGEDAYFTLIGTWTAASPFTVWVRFFITAAFTSQASLSLYIPRRSASEMVVGLYTLGGTILSAFVLGMGIAVVLENNKLLDSNTGSGTAEVLEERMLGCGVDLKLQ